MIVIIITIIFVSYLIFWLGTYDPGQGMEIITVTIPKGVGSYSLGLTDAQIANFYWFTTEKMDLRMATSARAYYLHQTNPDSGIYEDPYYTKNSNSDFSVNLSVVNGSWRASSNAKLTISVANNIFSIVYNGTDATTNPYVYNAFDITICCIPSSILL